MVQNMLSAAREMASLYAPLSLNEELELAKEMIAGDEEAKLTLIKHNARTALKIVRGFTIRDRDTRDDAEAAALVGLLKGLNQYDPAWCTRVSTFCNRHIWGEVWLTLVNAKVAHSVPIATYKKICGFVRSHFEQTKELPSDDMVTQFLMRTYKWDEYTASTIAAVSHAGVMRFADAFAPDEDGNDYQLDRINAENSVFGTTSVSPYIKIRMNEVSNRVENYCKKHLTKKQYLVIEMVILDYLRNQKVCTIRQASEKLLCNYQAVDQLLDYAMDRIGTNPEGAFVKRVINSVLELVVKNKKSDRNEAQFA